MRTENHTVGIDTPILQSILCLQKSTLQPTRELRDSAYGTHHSHRSSHGMWRIWPNSTNNFLLDDRSMLSFKCEKRWLEHASLVQVTWMQPKHLFCLVFTFYYCSLLLDYMKLSDIHYRIRLTQKLINHQGGKGELLRLHFSMSNFKPNKKLPGIRQLINFQIPNESLKNHITKILQMVFNQGLRSLHSVQSNLKRSWSC